MPKQTDVRAHRRKKPSGGTSPVRKHKRRSLLHFLGFSREDVEKKGRERGKKMKEEFDSQDLEVATPYGTVRKREKGQAD